MVTFILRRLLTIPFLLFGVSLITFTLMRMSPGDFFFQMEMDETKSVGDVLSQKESAGLIKEVAWAQVGEDRGSGAEFQAFGDSWRWDAAREQLLRNGDPQTMTQVFIKIPKFSVSGNDYLVNEAGLVYRKIGAVEGFLRWIGGVCVGDFGNSFARREPVFGLIFERLWNTLSLSLASLALAWGLAIPLGVFAAVRPNTFGDYVCSLMAFLGLSVPSVFFALLMVLFASYTGYFPIGDMRALDWEKLTTLEYAWNRLHHLILPTIVIGAGAMAQYMRQARGNMIEALSQDYVRTARAKGLAERQVLFKHALRNAINPLVTLFGYSLAALLSGSFLVEVVMNWPGIARLVVEGIQSKDEPVVLASVLLSSVLLIVGNLTADVLLAVVDPRVRLS